MDLTVVATGWLFSAPVSAGVEGVSFSLVPSAQYIFWDQDLGLDDGALYGPRAAINFGRRLSVQGYYLVNPNVETDLGGIVLQEGAPPLIDQELAVKNVGADLVLNLADGPVVPFVRGGGGVFHFEPDRGREFEQIGVKLGTGIRFQLLDRIRTHLFIEDDIFRLNRSALGAASEEKPAALSDPESDEMRHNVSAGIGFSVLLGGYETDEETELDRSIRSRFESGFFGASWPVEPFAGKLDFDGDARLGDQSLVGLRTGVNLGQLIGLRGYYWRGVSDDFDDTEPIQSWGGEAQFNLNAGQGAIPYLLLGAGEIDFLRSHRDELGARRTDKTSLILGGGIGFTLGRNLRLNASARDYIFSESGSDEIAATDDLLHNWSYTGGITLIFGKGPSSDAEIDALGRERRRAETAEDGRMLGAAAAPRAMRESTEPESERGALGEDRRSARRRFRAGRDDGAGPKHWTYDSNRMITLPAPGVGEVYVRYGEGGQGTIAWHSEHPAKTTADSTSNAGAGAASLREMVREEVRAAQLAASKGAPAGSASADGPPPLDDEARMELLERRIAERVADAIDKRDADRRGTTGQSPSQMVVLPPSQSTVITGPGGREETVVSSGGPSWKPANVHTYTGLNADDPEQWVLGARLDLGSISGRSAVRLVPEIAFGTFNKGSFLIAANAQHTFGQLTSKGAVRPYVLGGLGLLRFGKGVDRDRTEGVVNLGYGIARHFGGWIGFAEHQGVDLYSLHRINVGVRWVR